MGKLWTKEDIAFLKDNYHKYDMGQLSELMKRSKSTLYSKLNKLGLKKMWSKTEDFILKSNFPIKEYNEYSFLLPNRTYSSCLNRAYVLKLKKLIIKKRDYKYNLDHHFFSKVNNLNSYWSGFIAADGFISKEYSKLGIKLSIKDINHLENFKRDLQTDSPIKKFDRISFKKKRTYCQIDIYSDVIKNDLQGIFRIKNNKTFQMVSPNITDEHRFCFISGLIDGDGSICKVKNKISITLLGTENILQWCKKTLSEIVDISNISIIKKGNIFSFTITGDRCKSIKNKMMNLNIPLMDRKWKNIN